MQTSSPASSGALGTARSSVLSRHGFQPTSAGAWRRGRIVFYETDGWLVFTAPGPETADPLRDLSAPGLWKSFGDGRETRRQFSLRERWIQGEALLLPDEAASSFERVVDWALA